MVTLFLILFSCSLFTSVVARVKPKEVFKNKTEDEIKKAKKSLNIVTMFFFLLWAISGLAKLGQSVNPKSTQSSTTNNQSTSIDDIFSKNIKKIDSGMSYRSIKTEKADSDRPAGTKMITVSVNVDSFLNKNSLIRSSGKVSSSIFRTIFDETQLNAYDVIVWFYSGTQDKYGNQKDDVVLTYTMDKKTYEKINWDNFDQTGLCDFLESESKIDTGCKTLVNIQ